MKRRTTDAKSAAVGQVSHVLRWFDEIRSQVHGFFLKPGTYCSQEGAEAMFACVEGCVSELKEGEFEDRPEGKDEVWLLDGEYTVS